MQNPLLIKLLNDAALFAPLLLTDDSGAVTTVALKNKKRALKKLKAVFPEKELLIACAVQSEQLFSGKTLEYKNADYHILLALLESAVRECAKKDDIKIPASDIYIAAPPAFAARIISKIHNLARLFTVISQDEPYGAVYDELYFKYGSVVRQIPDINNDVKEDCMIIRAREWFVPLWLKCPIIDLFDAKEKTAKTVTLSKKRIDDDFSREIEKIWGGYAGAYIYSLFGKMPGENARLQIDKNADEIFLLDTAAI